MMNIISGFTTYIRQVAAIVMIGLPYPATSAITSGPSEFGPHLEALVSRKVAAIADYDYSDDLLVQTFYWTEEELDHWLQHPQHRIRGLCMPFTGLANEEHRKALIAYLKSL